MEGPLLTVLYWNVWSYSQDGHTGDGTSLVKRLTQIIADEKPDLIGFNEVLTDRKTGKSPVLELLHKLGYQTHYAEFSPISEKWMTGNVLATRLKPEKITEYILGDDTQAARRGYPGYHVKLIEAPLNWQGKEVTFVINYLCNLLPKDWLTHIRHRRAFEAFANKSAKNTIIGGDFNETKYMLPWLRLPARWARKTGSLWRPTWRLNGKTYLPFIANYDQLMYSKDGDLELVEFKVLKRAPSDHSPLLARFKIKS